MRLIPIHPENLNMAWPDVIQFITDGIEYCDGKYTLTDIYDMIKREELILWVVYNDDKKKAIGCLLTSVFQYPQTRALSIFMLSGNFEEIMIVYDDLIQYAKRIGCERIEFYGRPGWERMLKPLNFEKIHTVMRLKL